MIDAKTLMAQRIFNKANGAKIDAFKEAMDFEYRAQARKMEEMLNRNIFGSIITIDQAITISKQVWKDGTRDMNIPETTFTDADGVEHKTKVLG